MLANRRRTVPMLVRELPVVPRQYFKNLEGTDDLCEVRPEFGGDAFRLLGFWDVG